MKRAMATALILLICAEGFAADYRRAALDAGEWIRSTAVQTEKGTAWPADPADRASVNATLYSGVPGIVLFFLEAYRSTGDAAYLKDARAGADYLLAHMLTEKESGLYTGLAGIGFTLIETYKATRDEKYRQGARACVQSIKDRANRAGKGVEWSEVSDIIGGGAGTGLFLLYAARELNDKSARDLAVEAGHRMVELGQAEKSGLKWAMTPKFPRLMPNFSHGTAGSAYFLATLYGETKKREFLDAALAGASYLKSIAKTEGDLCLIFHHEPGGENLYYLGWCHGPVGTARLFYRLYKVTGDRSWMDLVARSARAVIESGIPEKRTEGFWNNVSQCCGSAGVAEFFLSLYQATMQRQYLDFSKRVTANLLERSTRAGRGLKWVQAEHRVKPDLLVAQTGFMQGASGIGLWLLRLDRFERGDNSHIVFPDSPF
ncbi:MAG TPA: lanthionine synthetase LanC family protein [Blastocatellia bacterium]|nr:lanthionine synthetase LanC family protein [Blastocatellia bacterium]